MMRSQTQQDIRSLSIPIQEESISVSVRDRSRTSGIGRRTWRFIKEMPYSFVLFCALLSIAMFALGFIMGYLIFKPSSTTTIPPSTSTTVLTSPSTLITTSSQSTITSSQTNTATTSSPNRTTITSTSYSSNVPTTTSDLSTVTTTTAGSSTVTTTTPSVSTATTTTSDLSNVTTTTSGSSNVPTTVTTSSSEPVFCPPILPNVNHSTILLSLDDTTMSDFHYYSIEYVSPVNVSIAMLMFEFNTVWGSWFLDDVSIKESNIDGEEMMDNGGFETGNLGSKWKFCDARYSYITDGTVAGLYVHSGNYSYESQSLDVGSNEYLAQVFNIESNTSYTIEFYLFSNDGPYSASVTVISG